MSNHSSKGDYKVTDAFLTDFANTKVQKFIADSASSQSILLLTSFSNGGSSNGNDVALLGGNTSKLTAAKNLQDAFKTYAGQVVATIIGPSGMTAEMTKIKADLLAVKHIAQQGEDDASSLSGTDLMTDLGDILGGKTTGSPNGNGA